MTAGRRRDAGFTLLEILVAMTVIGVLMALLASGVGFGARIWEREHDQLDRWSEMATTQELLRRMLSQALPLPGMQAQGAGVPEGPFRGTASTMGFVGPAPTRSVVGGLYEYEIAARNEGNGPQLVLTWRLHSPDRSRTRTRSRSAFHSTAKLPEPPPPHDVVLMDHIADVKFEYYGAEDVSERPRWRDRWENPQKSPMLVRVKVTFPEHDRRSWPEFVVPLNVSGGLEG